MTHVPTVAELAAKGLARPAAWTARGAPTHWRISAEGQQLIYDAMHENALVPLTKDEEAERMRAAIVKARQAPNR